MAEAREREHGLQFRMTRHAEEEIARRGIPRAAVDSVLSSPQEVVPGSGGRKVCQSRVEMEGGRTFLVRVVVDDRGDSPVVVTAYRTSKLGKYGRGRA